MVYSNDASERNKLRRKADPTNVRLVSRFGTEIEAEIKDNKVQGRSIRSFRIYDYRRSSYKKVNYCVNL